MVYGCNIVLGADINEFLYYDDDKYCVFGSNKKFEKKIDALHFIIQKVEESSLGIITYGACPYNDLCKEESNEEESNEEEELKCILGINIMSMGWDELYDSVKMHNFLKYKKEIEEEFYKFFNCNFDIDIHYLGYP